MKFTIDLPKSYDPSKIEQSIYKFWDENKLFNPDTQLELGLVKKNSPRFCLTLPPPNVTGVLHLGHAITIAIEDLMVRFERMNQKQTLFLPGSDHAGIATQNVVERELKKKGIKRKEIGREKFVEEVWKWKKKSHKVISNQSRSLGMSSDWSRERFTLDDDLSLAVRTAFVTLFKKDLIYRGNYMVNWCPGRCESAISDLESIPEELDSNLWYIKYPIMDQKFSEPQDEWGSGNWAKGATKFIEVATTRPETLLGDTAIATHKKHKQFGKLIGKTAILPVNARKIKVIQDSHVDPEFGTGAVKVTPAHDPNDYEIGKRHDLEFITVMNETGEMIPEYSGKYANLDRFEARKQIVEDLKKEGLLSKIEPYKHSVGHCERCHTIIEPRISTQWFVRTKGLANAAIEKVRSGETKILPEREEKRFYHWMENILDWCISRQLWWGHRIPVWYCDNDHQTSEIEDPTECSTCGSKNLTQDEDVLDTWFSSGLWPFSTLGWPNTKSPDFKRYYSTNMRETGYDILFFWVAREMMLGIELTGETPYSTVYFHGIVRNEVGKKISKSMENIEQYDPLNIIKEHGADSLRYTLVSNAVPGLDINLDPKQLDASHKFCNKIWQSTKFVLMQVTEGDNLQPFNIKDLNKLHVTDKWILSKLNTLVKETTSFYTNYEYLKASRDIKTFFWNVFCDWYLETTKNRLYDDSEKDKFTPKMILSHVLETCLKLLHPIIPHLTEVLWQSLPESVKTDKALIISKWPQFDKNLIFEAEETNVSIVIDLITGIRRIRSEFNVAQNVNVPVIIDTEMYAPIIEEMIPEIISMAKVDREHLEISSKIPKNSARLVLENLTAYIPLEGVIDRESEYNRISKQHAKVSKQITSLEKKLEGPFSERAKPEIVQQEKQKLESLKGRIQLLNDQLNILK